MLAGAPLHAVAGVGVVMHQADLGQLGFGDGLNRVGLDRVGLRGQALKAVAGIGQRRAAFGQGGDGLHLRVNRAQARTAAQQEQQ